MEKACGNVTCTSGIKFSLANKISFPKPSPPLLEGIIFYLSRAKKVASPSRIFSVGGYGSSEFCCILHYGGWRKEVYSSVRFDL